MNRNNHIVRIFFAGLLGAAAPVAQLYAAEADKNLPNILLRFAAGIFCRPMESQSCRF